MAIGDWNWLLPRDNQDYPWDCSAASTAWCTRTVGYSYTEQDLIVALGPSRISATYGLLDASGAGLVSCLADLGIGSENNANASWEDIMAAAGYQPMVIGGRGWCHWVAVRMGSRAAGLDGTDALALMNPAPGWEGVNQMLEEWQFNDLGPFSAVWFTDW